MRHNAAGDNRLRHEVLLPPTISRAVPPTTINLPLRPVASGVGDPRLYELDLDPILVDSSWVDNAMHGIGRIRQDGGHLPACRERTGRSSSSLTQQHDAARALEQRL